LKVEKFVEAETSKAEAEAEGKEEEEKISEGLIMAIGLARYNA